MALIVCVDYSMLRRSSTAPPMDDYHYAAALQGHSGGRRAMDDLMLYTNTHHLSQQYQPSYDYEVAQTISLPPSARETPQLDEAVSPKPQTRAKPDAKIGKISRCVYQACSCLGSLADLDADRLTLGFFIDPKSWSR